MRICGENQASKFMEMIKKFGEWHDMEQLLQDRERLLHSALSHLIK